MVRKNSVIKASLLVLIMGIIWSGLVIRTSGATVQDPNGDVMDTGNLFSQDIRPAKSSFQDVTASDPNLIYITYINQRGIITGFPDGSYHPGEGLNRAQAAVIICKAAGLKATAPQETSFKDVPADHWAAGYIEAAIRAGYLTGYPDGRYKPDKYLTRAEGVSLVMRLCTQKDRAPLPQITDINDARWAANDIATALAMGMIGSSADGKKVYPNAQMSRGSLARSLAVLLTTDPGLNPVKMEGRIKEIKGTATLTRQGEEQVLKENSPIYTGDQIKTGVSSSVRIDYPDGSSNLLDQNTRIEIKRSDGRSCIKQDGSMGIAVEYLNLDLKQGTMYSTLAARHEAEEIRTSQSNKLAALESFKNLAVNDSSPNIWYKTAEKKKVKVKVDMPWGIAAIRGTYIKVSVYPDGKCKVACLTGDAEISGNEGSSVAVNGGQTGRIDGENEAPQSSGPLTAQDKQEFDQHQDWILNTALQQDLNQSAESAPPVVEIITALPDKTNETATPQVREAIKTGSPTQTVETGSSTVDAVINALRGSGIELSEEVINNIKQQIEQVQGQEQVSGGQTQEQSEPDSNTNNNGGGETIISFSSPGTYGGSAPDQKSVLSSVNISAENVTLHNANIQGNLTVSNKGAALDNLNISGNLVLAAGIGEGDVTLQNVTVSGQTKINGGGSSSIHIRDSQLQTVEVDKIGSRVRIVAEGNTNIGTLTIYCSVELTEENLTGSGFTNIISANYLQGGTCIILKGDFDSLDIKGAGSRISLTAGSLIRVLIANAGVNLDGAGQITTAVINVAGVVLEQTPTNWNIAPGISANIGGQNQTGSHNNADSTPPVFLNAAVSDYNRLITLNFDEPILNNTGSDADLRKAISFSCDGQAFYTLTNAAQLSISGPQLFITFDNPIDGANNKIRVNSNALKDTSGNAVDVVETGDIQATAYAGPAYQPVTAALLSVPEEDAFYGLATDASGNMYLTGEGGHIRKLDSAGTYVTEWGEYGSGDGQIDNAVGITVDNDGYIYVADSNNNRVQKFDPAGNFVCKWGTEGSGEGQFIYPGGIAADPNGNIYVTDSENNRVQKFDNAGNYICQWGTEGSGDGQLEYPVGIAIDALGVIYITDSGNCRVQKFDCSGNYISQWGSQGSGEGQFMAATGIMIDPCGYIFVADWLNQRVQKYDTSGNLLGSFTAIQLGYAGLASNSGYINVASIALVTYKPGFIAPPVYSEVAISNDNRRITLNFDEGIFNNTADDQSLKAAIGLSNNGIDFSALSADDSVQISGSSLIIDLASSLHGEKNRVQIGSGSLKDALGNVLEKQIDTEELIALPYKPVITWGSEGSAEGQFNFPKGIALDASGNIYVVDTTNNRIQYFDATGQFLGQWGSAGNGNGQFNSPTGLAFDSLGNIFVVDAGNSRVQKFDSAGTYAGQWGTDGYNDSQFKAPWGITIDSDNNVYISDSYFRVQKFDNNGGFIKKIWRPQRFIPWGITLDAANNIYLTDTFEIDKIGVYDQNSQLLNSWGTNGHENLQFSEPRGIARDTSGNIYVVDMYNARVQKLDSSGNFICKWGSSGSGEGQFSYPNGIAVDPSGRVYVVDTNNHRIQVFEPIP
ncbi:MAG: 6-bladed beta-propeller [Deltaproteobacteria bacterium]